VPLSLWLIKPEPEMFGLTSSYEYETEQGIFNRETMSYGSLTSLTRRSASMPFTTTNVPPVLKPLVTVEFAGLLLLKPGDNNTCEVGIHRFARSHIFQLSLIVNRPDKNPTLTRLLSGPLTGDIKIRLHPDSSAGNVLAFAPTAEPFTRTAHAGNDDKDYRWSLNLKMIHPNASVTDGARPIATLRTGVLYTPTLTRVGLDPKLIRLGSPEISLFKVAADLAASIAPPEGHAVVVEWTDMGDPQDIILPRQVDPVGTTYTVSLLNDPPSLDPTPHDELADYYKVLLNNGAVVPANERWALTYSNAQRTDEIPCLPTVLNP
jgi:hypothetical protein